MKKKIGSVSLATILAVGLVLGGAGGASAGAATLGSKSCTGSSSVSTQAYGNYAVTFNAFISNHGARTIVKGSASNAVSGWHHAYWSSLIGKRVDHASSGGASNAGSLSSVAWFCDY